MRAEVLLPRAGGYAAGADRLYTYRVPEHLAGCLVPGQLVSVPFGERSVAGIVWALDASDDADPTPDAAGAAARRSRPRLRSARRHHRLPAARGPDAAAAAGAAPHRPAPGAELRRLDAAGVDAGDQPDLWPDTLLAGGE